MRKSKLALVALLAMVGVVGTAYSAWVFGSADAGKDVGLAVGIDKAYSGGSIVTTTPAFTNVTGSVDVLSQSGVILSDTMTATNTFFTFNASHTNYVNPHGAHTESHVETYPFYEYKTTITVEPTLLPYIDVVADAANAWDSSGKVAYRGTTAETLKFTVAWKTGKNPSTAGTDLAKIQAYDTLYDILDVIKAGSTPAIKITLEAKGSLS